MTCNEPVSISRDVPRENGNSRSRSYLENKPHAEERLCHEKHAFTVQQLLQELVERGSVPHGSGSCYRQVCRNDDLVPIISDEDLAWAEALGKPGRAPRPLPDAMADARKVFSTRVPLDHPRFLSYIPSAPSAVSWLGGVLGDSFNTMCGSWKLSRGVSTLEQSLLAWLADKAGLPSTTSGGIFVSGGSNANLTAMTVARDNKLGQDLARRARGVAYLSAGVHFCVEKCLKVIGLVPHQIRVLPSKCGRMDLEILRQTIETDIRDGLLPFLVVATCGTTNMGIIDPLDDIAVITRSYNLWLHVDGSFGASAALCYSRRHLVSGLAHADSIAWDAHKWLFQTYGCGISLVRDKMLLAQSFATGADYIQDLHTDKSNPWDYGIELTRPARHMKLWLTLHCLGLDAISDMIEHGCTTAETLESELRRMTGWEIVSSASLAILNFRHTRPGLSNEQLDAINVGISSQLLQRNVAAISTTKCNGKLCLRVCTINPRTGDEDIRDILSALDQAASIVGDR